MKKLLISVIFSILPVLSYAQLVTNPGIIPTNALTPGSCLQATGSNSIATIGTPGTPTPCGAGSGTVSGPSSSTAGNLATWGNDTGTALTDSNIAASNIGLLSSEQTFTGLNTFTNTSTFSGYNDALNINGGSGTFRGNFYETNGVNRWGEGASVDPEQGNNSGSSWILQSYGDNGSVGVTAINVSRATGIVNFGVRPSFGNNTPWDSGNFNPSNYLTNTSAASTYLPISNPTANGALTVNGTWVTVSGTSGAFQRYTTNTLGSASYPTWEWGTDGTSQTGSNSGSNFGLWAMSDTGVVLSEPIAITRSTGAIAFGSTPTAPTASAGSNNNSLATTQFVQSAIAGGGSSPNFTNVNITGTLAVAGTTTISGVFNAANVANFNNSSTFAGSATFNYPIYSNFSFIGGSNSVMQVPVIQVTGTSNTQGILDSGQLQVSGNTVLGATNGSTSVISNGPITAKSTVQLMGYTVSTLPTGNIGMTAYVTDAVICGFNSYVSGGGSLFCPVIYNGSGWVGG
jgi:hypothetical protein